MLVLHVQCIKECEQKRRFWPQINTPIKNCAESSCRAPVQDARPSNLNSKSQEIKLTFLLFEFKMANNTNNCDTLFFSP